MAVAEQKGITMKKSIVVILSVLWSSFAFAQTSDVPSLGDVIGSLSSTELDTMVSSVDDTGITSDLDLAVDTAVINQAVSEGLITETEAADIETALGIVEANAQFFDFDIANTIGEAIANGVITAAQAAETLKIFNQLSDAGKTLVGNEGFAATSGNAYYDGLTDADKALVDSSPIN